ncbi:TfoX/Sxy family protein [Phreatobacter sp. AB_2022a]|uniref:TfoX/Sxy family protein n=1 Tax=Phreatobacter sp. AB_2022a TaxID=3003134 RepID=UPI002286ECCD|nr:TfoX/Sxy family protein [Phreatobacter sp. AB_2022a]MCZ0733417.1 TfoX/Sxy family protein [Phreatobacter sp. AB_2022a]
MRSGLIDPDVLKDLFQPFGPIVVRTMFGGQGIMRDGLMFALVHDGVVYLKSDAEADAAFTAENCPPFVMTTRAGKEMGLNYRRMPEACYDDEASVRQWAGLAWSAALRAAARRPVPRPSRGGKPKASRAR